MSKNYAGLRCLLDVLEDTASELQSRLDSNQKELDEVIARNAKIEQDEEGHYHIEEEDGLIRNISYWDADYYRSQEKTYSDKIKAYDYVLSLLASVDLNKVKM